MHRTLLLIPAAVAALAIPAAATAADDADILAGDPPAITTVYTAGGATHGTFPGGDRAFVRSLVAAAATGGVLQEDTRGYTHPTVIRKGFARPTTALAPFRGRDQGARGRVVVKWTTQPDGLRTVERAFAVEIATGKVVSVSLDDARRFSADPRSGKAGLQYFYSMESDLPAGAPLG